MKTKVYVITGATSGIGKALLEVLAQENIVFAGYRDEKNLKFLKEISEKVIPFYVDYAIPETIEEAVSFIKSQVNKIDTLINVAGCVVAGPVECLAIDDIKHQFDVNVFGHLQFTQGLLNCLKDGKIINISSMASFGIFPFISPYCASKKCLDMFFNSLLIENKKNLKIVSVKPGVIVTPLWEKSIEKNKNNIYFSIEYDKEMQFLKKNAENNGTKGLCVDKVVKLILKIDKSKNPKLSYTIGIDAFCASLISKLPQCVVNKIIKLALKLRMKG